MKKSLLKKLTCMARDGDPEAIEALAEAVEEIMENPSADPESAAVVIAAETEPEAAAPAGEDPSAAADEDTLSAILERLDQLIALLAPAAPAADDDPDSLPENLAEIISEAVEAAEPAIGSAAAEEAASLVEELVDPAVSTVLEPEEEEEEEPVSREAGDALRAALRAIRPALRRMPRRERIHVCADIAASLKKTGMDSRAYAALMSAAPRRPGNPADLGKQIMAARNPNYK